MRDVKKKLVLFDFDGTLVKGDTFIQFIFYYSGYLKGVSGFILFSPLILLYGLRIVRAETLKEKLVSFYFKDKPESQLKEKGKLFIELLETNNGLKAEILEKMKFYEENGDEVCVVSASLNIWVEPFSKKFKVGCLCTEIEFIDGKCTGNFLTSNCNKEEKAARVKRFYDCGAYSKIIAFGNSIKDSAMFDIADEVIKVV